jgi:hypothetical protein
VLKIEHKKYEKNILSRLKRSLFYFFFFSKRIEIMGDIEDLEGEKSGKISEAVGKF